MTTFEPSSRFAPPEKLKVNLVSSESSDIMSRDWTVPASTLLSLGVSGLWRVRGAAGSGVTSLLVDATLARLNAGVDPNSILFLTASRESAAKIRSELARRLPASNYAAEGSMVRPVHSFAFSLLRAAAVRNGDPAPRMMTGAELDAITRELLSIQAEDGAAHWPAQTRDALPLVGFARQLRDFLLRAAERGLGPDELERLGREYDRPMWVSAGNYLREQEQLLALGAAPARNASELTVGALNALAIDPDLFLTQAERISTIIVDDAQNLDPKSAELISKFLPSAQLAVIAGNPDHAVFSFRGASADFLNNLGQQGGRGLDHDIVLEEQHRCPEDISIVYADSPSTHAAVVTDKIRRAHLLDGVPWKDMAVIVRSSSMIAPLRRILLSAGVPVRLSPTDVVLSQQRLVSNLLLCVRALTEPLTPSQLEDLALGPIGGADPVTMRRLLRGLRQGGLKAGDPRRGIELLAALVLTPESENTDELSSALVDRELEVLSRLRAVIAAGQESLSRQDTVEMTLWEIWNATGLSDHLMNSSLRGGAAGSQADLDLDAMMTLFDAAGDFAERRPTASLASFVDHIEEQELPTGARDRRGAATDAVTIVTAHGAGGYEWHTVVVAGVQENSWPTLGETGSLFGQEELVDFVDRGIDPGTPVSQIADRLAEERRLFGLATSRATQSLLVTAVQNDDSDEVDEPSRFLRELAEKTGTAVDFVGPEDIDVDDILGAEGLGDLGGHHVEVPRVLSVSHIIAELRRTLENEGSSASRKQHAARQLARLAEAGIYGAHPDDWWGLRGASTSEPLMPLGKPVSLSPSKIEAAMECPLRAVMSRLGEEDGSPIYLLKGTLVHAYAEALARGVNPSEATEFVNEAFENLMVAPAWKADFERAEWRQMLDNTRAYVEAHKGVGQQFGVEVGVKVQVGETTDGQPLYIGGRIDRLEANSDGEFVVVDLKTGKTTPSKEKVQEHPQLKAYQLALSRGEWNAAEAFIGTASADSQPIGVGGGVLVYVAGNKASTRDQDPKQPEELQEFAETLPDLTDQLRGPNLIARINENCERCQVRSICPVQQEGMAVTHV